MATYNVGGLNPFNKKKTIYEAVSIARGGDDINWNKSEKYEGIVRISEGIDLIGSSKNFKVPEHSIGLQLNGSGQLVLRNLIISVTALANAIQVIKWRGSILIENCKIEYRGRIKEDKAYPLFASNEMIDGELIIRDSIIDGVNVYSDKLTLSNVNILGSKMTSRLLGNTINIDDSELSNVNIEGNVVNMTNVNINDNVNIIGSETKLNKLLPSENSLTHITSETSMMNEWIIDKGISGIYLHDGTFNLSDMTIPNVRFGAMNSNIELGDNLINEATWGEENVTYSNVSKENEVMGIEAEGSAKDELFEMIGLENVKEQFNTYVATARIGRAREEAGLENKDMGMHLIFGGDPGTGKTVVANLMARALYEEGITESPVCIVGSRKTLVDKYVGATAERTAKEIEKARGGIFFLDEAHRFINTSDKDHANEAMGEILTFSENHRDEVIFILAGYTDKLQDFFENGDPGMRSRFSNWIEFPNYSFEELFQISLLMLKDFNISEDDKYAIKRNLFKFYSDKMIEGNARFVRNFTESIIMAQHLRLNKSEAFDKATLMQITADDIEEGSSTLRKNLNR